MLNIYEQIDSNKRRSALVIAFFIAFVTAFGYFFTYLYNYDYSFLFLALLLSSVGSVVSYYNSDTLALTLAGAKPATRRDYPEYLSAVENLAQVAQIPLPKTYIIESHALNAFATGRDPAHGAVAVTRGLLDKLTRTELEGVIAHELSHIKNFDTRLMTIVAVLVGSIALILNWSWRLSWHRGSSRDESKGGNAIIMVIGLIFIILAPIIAKAIQLAISRRREFLADASGVMLTRQPSGLIGALEKIAKYENTYPLESANTATAHLYIDDPVTSETHGTWLANLFSTHPPIRERIMALEGKAV